MINLLLESEKIEIKKELLKKTTVMLGWTVFWALLAFYFMLLPVASALVPKDTQEQQFDISLQEEIFRYNRVLKLADSVFPQNPYAHKALLGIANVEKPAGTRIDSINLQKDPGAKKIRASVAGISETRDGLASFKKNLESEKGFSNVSFSSSSWIKSENAEFSATFDINEANE